MFLLFHTTVLASTDWRDKKNVDKKSKHWIEVSNHHTELQLYSENNIRIQHYNLSRGHATLQDALVGVRVPGESQAAERCNAVVAAVAYVSLDGGN